MSPSIVTPSGASVAARTRRTWLGFLPTAGRAQEAAPLKRPRSVTGKDGGKLSKLADFTMHVPSQLIEQVEDAHLVIAHSLCVVLRERLRTDLLLCEVDCSVLQESIDQQIMADLR